MYSWYQPLSFTHFSIRSVSSLRLWLSAELTKTCKLLKFLAISNSKVFRWLCQWPGQWFFGRRRIWRWYLFIWSNKNISRADHYFTPRLFQLTSLRSDVNFDTINLASESSLEFFQVFFHKSILMRLPSTNHCQTELVLLLIK